MIKYHDQLDLTFHALSDATRRSILETLQHEQHPLIISELAHSYPMSFPAVSKHIRVLEHAGLVKRRKLGRTQAITLRHRNAGLAQKWLITYTKFWNQQLDSLEKHLERTKSG